MGGFNFNNQPGRFGTNFNGSFTNGLGRSA